MKGKLLFLTGGAIGYVLGARAGRKRYEQIKSAAAKIWETDGIQKQVQTAEDYVANKIGDVPEAVMNGVKKVVSTATSRKSGKRSGASGQSAAAAATTPDKIVTVETGVAGDATLSSGSSTKSTTKSDGKSDGKSSSTSNS